MTTQMPVKPLPIEGQVLYYNKCKAVSPDAEGKPHEFGKNKTSGNLELILQMIVPDRGGEIVSTRLTVTKDAWPYSRERLKSLGWKGEHQGDLHTLDGIDQNEVDMECRRDPYVDPQTNTTSHPYKWQILTGGGGRFHTGQQMTGKEFAANAVALLGPPSGGSGNSGGAPPPPF